MRSIFKSNDIFRCYQCNKTVERVESYYDPATCSRQFTVYCHGEKETSNLSDYVLYDTIDIVEARCFTQGKLIHDNSN